MVAVTPPRKPRPRARRHNLLESLEPRTLLAGNPTLFTLTGNGTPIGDTTPSSTDATLLGWATPGNNTPLTATFTITDLGGLTLNSPAVTVTSNTGNLYTVSQPTLNAGTASFTVTYNPTTALAGTHAAVIHLASNDPNQPDFQFTVAANQLPSIDLVPAIAPLRLPATILSGITKKIQVPVWVGNAGKDMVRGFTPPIDFNLLLRNSSGNDTYISTAFTPNLRGLTPGHTKNEILFLNVPASIPTGTYTLVLKINTLGLLTETNLDNDTVLSSQTLNIVQPFYDLADNFVSSTLPNAITAGQKISGSVFVDVMSLGNIQLNPGEKASLAIMARDTTTNVDTFLGSARFSIAGFNTDQAATFTVTLKKNATPFLPPGTYSLVAVLVSSLPDINPANNTNVSNITLTVS